MKCKASIAASVKARLLDISRARGEDFNLILGRYSLERLLYRLCRSAYADQFVLKGAMLFALWSDDPYRATRDLDFLKFGDARAEDLQKLFQEVAKAEVEDDGLEFLPETVRAARIRDDNEYGGIRTNLRAMLGSARISIQVDVGFGDVVTPHPDILTYPTLLDSPAPRLRCYPRETVVAEKYQAMVHLGLGNSRMKDYYDVWVLANHFDFDGSILAEAIVRTFERRATTLPAEVPQGLSSEFKRDVVKTNQWRAFVRTGTLVHDQLALPDVCDFIGEFLLPPTKSIMEHGNFNKFWLAPGPWK